MKKNFTFQGIDAKYEWRLGLLSGIPAFFIFLGTLMVSHSTLQLNFIISALIASGLTLTVVMLVLKQLSRLMKNKIWTALVDGENLKISFQNKIWEFQLSDIRILKNIGNVGFRYLTIITKTETIKIRVGNTGFVPFSTEEDIHILDELLGNPSSIKNLDILPTK